MTLFTTLTSISTTIEPMETIPAWTRPDGVCPAFQWIGQSFSSCDRCGQPYWDHTHEEHAADGSLPFSVRVRHKVISPDQREACRAKWDRGIA